MAFRDSQVAQAGLKGSKIDDVSNASNTKLLSIKNRRAAGNWKHLVRAIEIQKIEKSTELNYNRNKLLGKRDEIQTRTISLSKTRSVNFQEEKPTLLKVCNTLMASIGKQEQRKSNIVSENITRHTQSSERKKVVRKNVCFSLSELRKQGLETNMKFKEENMVNLEQNSNFNDDDIEHTRPQSAFDYTEEEEEINRQLYCSPSTLPRIYLQTSHRPRFRSFDKNDEEYRTKMICNEDSWKDIHHCRHLRIQKRPRTVHDFIR